MDLGFLARSDFDLGNKILGGWRDPDLMISPDGKPYLYRWYIIPRNDDGNVYFHIQVADDPGRDPHDHPYYNCSVILAGGYVERLYLNPESRRGRTLYSRILRQPGDVIFRQATTAHNLVLAGPYSMSLFTTGPKIRDWGFWTPDGFVSHEQCTITERGISKMRNSP